MIPPVSREGLDVASLELISKQMHVLFLSALLVTSLVKGADLCGSVGRDGNISMVTWSLH